ncbi:MAG TPA: hypothetical protein VFL65_10310 [Jatrophihabitans sp.]|nr:hypothetical protein [Jatrophihabitans sp.]
MPPLKSAVRRLDTRAAAIALVVVAALWFMIDPPRVGDFWAAQARQSAALHGVGLRYWFSWFDGIVPGNYSVLTPFITPFVDAAWLGALSTVVVVGLTHRLVRDSRHPTAATWLAAIGATMSLWSGRIPFALGTALMLLALLGLRANRRIPTVLAAAGAALASPVSGVFLILGVTGVLVHDRDRRLTAAAGAGVAGACLLGLAWYFGMPGPEGYPLTQAVLVPIGIGVLLLTRPPAYVRTVLLLSLAACPFLILVPNGMGSNFNRFTWICLPVAAAATARIPAWRSTLVAGLAVAVGVAGSARDLYIAAQPISSETYYAGLVARLDHTPGLADHRVEVVPDGTHVAAFVLLDHAQLARGYETQSDNTYDRVLGSPSLDAAGYRAWLDANAVAYVALDRSTLSHNPEDRLVRDHRPGYLRTIWADAHWMLFAVRDPVPIVAAPARVSDADQSNLVISVPRPGRYELRVHWSRFLRVPAGARLEPDGRGWSVLDTTRPGLYTLGS